MTEPAAERGRICVIIPAYREEGRIGAVVRSSREHAPGTDVIVVDDGSTETETMRQLRECAALPNVHVHVQDDQAGTLARRNGKVGVRPQAAPAPQLVRVGGGVLESVR